MKSSKIIAPLLVLAILLTLSGCGAKSATNPAAEAPPAAQVIAEPDANLVTVDHPDQFPVVSASSIDSAPSLTTNGSVNPDVARQIPVVSLASGRVIDIHARLGDTVHKGQLLMRIQSADVSSAFADYEKAVADEKLARAQLERAKDLKEKGAIAQKDLEVAENADEDAKVTVETTAEHLRVLGADINHPSGLIEIRAPASGVITEQNVTAAAGVKTLDNSPNLFTISDLSQVWIICDVYENDLDHVKVGELADIHLASYPGLVLKGRISEIGPSLDPAIRTAKVRLQVVNPGVLRVGMFVTATFHALKKQLHAVVPASAILHLHDREWVYAPEGSGKFRRVEVVSGKILPQDMQEITSGLKPGDRIVSNALVLQNTAEQ